MLTAAWMTGTEPEATTLHGQGLMGAGQWAVVSNPGVRPPYWARITGEGEAGALGSEQTHLWLKRNLAK